MSSPAAEPLERRWKTVKGYPNYKIADKPDYHRRDDGAQVLDKRKDEFVSIFAGPDLYRRVNLWQGRNHKQMKISILVATAFVPNPNNHPEVDHVECERDDDDATKLEWVTHAENQQNKGKQARNSTGGVPSSKYKGVYWYARTKSWKAEIKFQINGKKEYRFLGYFKKESDARKAYDAAALRYHTKPRTNERHFGVEKLAKWDEEEEKKLAKEKQEEEMEEEKKEE